MSRVKRWSQKRELAEEAKVKAEAWEEKTRAIWRAFRMGVPRGEVEKRLKVGKDRVKKEWEAWEAMSQQRGEAA